MALPSNFNTVEVRGRFVDLAGSPVVGSLIFTPTAPVMTSIAELTTIIGRSLQVDLIAGQFAVSLPATDDPDITPLGFLYEVEERFQGLRGRRKYTVAVPVALAETGFDLMQSAPAPDGVLVPYAVLVDGGAPDSTYPAEADGGTP